MKIIQEASVYDDEKLVDDVEDASKVATNFLTEITSDGVFVHEEGVTDPTASGANGVHISDTVKIIRDGEAVAEYGDAAVIGKADESRARIDYHSFQMIDKDGNEYANISDLRNEAGVATITENFVGDGGKTYPVSNAVSSVISVTVEEVERTDYEIDSNNRLVFDTNISDGDSIVIQYETTDSTFSYTFGTRNSASRKGSGSFTNGFNCSARGRASHAEGKGSSASGSGAHAEGAATIARGDESHAEGWNSIARGTQSHAEGWQTAANAIAAHSEGMSTTASGKHSHSQNYGTTAASDNQTAIGKYNIEDDEDTYAFILGNGGSDNNRSNAMTVDWNGNIKSSGFTVPCMIKTTWSNQTCTGSARATISGLTVPNLPSTATVLGVTVMTTPNDHWIKAYGYVGSNNTIGINYHNESSSSITGAFSVLIFFTL